MKIAFRSRGRKENLCVRIEVCLLSIFWF